MRTKREKNAKPFKPIINLKATCLFFAEAKPTYLINMTMAHAHANYSDTGKIGTPIFPLAKSGYIRNKILDEKLILLVETTRPTSNQQPRPTRKHHVR
jgi:hypothetical protein